MMYYEVNLGVAYSDHSWEDKCLILKAEDANHACVEALRKLTWNHIHCWIISCEILEGFQL